MATNMKLICSVHQDAVAKAVCFEKKELLCFNCAIERAKLENSDNIQDIDKISEGKEWILLKYLVLNQKASQKEKHIVEYERKVEKEKEKVEYDVNTFYSEFEKKTHALKENSISSIRTQAKDLLQTFEREKEEFGAVQKVIIENFETLLVDKNCDIESYKSGLEKVSTKFTDEIIEVDSVPYGDFIPHKYLNYETYKSEDGLGKVTLFNDYPLPNQDETNETEEAYPAPSANTDSIQSETTKSNESTTSCNTESDSKTKCKEEKSRKPMFSGMFRTKKKTQSEASDGLYGDVTSGHKESLHAKHLINTSKSVSGLESPNKAPFQFSKIVAVGDDRVGLLSSSHSLVAVTMLDGTVSCSKTYTNPVSSIVAMGKNQLAILSLTEGPQLQVVDVNGSQIEDKYTIDITFELSDITGLDYSTPKSNFAIGTKTKYVIIDNKGKKVRSTDIAAADSSAIATTYDFKKKRYFVLNIEEKSLKCVVLKSLECIWKYTYGEEQFNPKVICLYKDELCVTSSHTITIFSAKDGKSKRKHDTSALLDSCLGICVIDDVLVISSDSDNFEESAKLCFIGL